MLIEVCCGSYNDAIYSSNMGIKRIELNSALELGGLTPFLETLSETKNNTDLKIMCMLRCRAGNFVYDDNEFDIMLKQCDMLIKNGADGIVFGALNSDFSIDQKKTKTMIDIVHKNKLEFVFHRAFDISQNLLEVEKLIDMGADRLLTSGQAFNAHYGRDNLHKLQRDYGKDIEILAGSGINAENVLDIISHTGVKQIHGSFSKKIKQFSANNSVDFDQYMEVDEDKIQQIKAIIDNYL